MTYANERYTPISVEENVAYSLWICFHTFSKKRISGNIIFISSLYFFLNLVYLTKPKNIQFHPKVKNIYLLIYLTVIKNCHFFCKFKKQLYHRITHPIHQERKLPDQL